MNGFQGNIATFKEAIAVFKKYAMEFIVAFIIFIVITIVMQFLPDFILPKDEQFMSVTPMLFVSMIVGIVLSIIFFFVSYAIQIGLIKIILDGIDGGRPDLKDFYKQYKRIPSYLFAVTVASIISIIGFFLFIFSTFPLTARYQFAHIFVIDKKVGLGEALHLSDVATRGSLWKVIKLDIFLFLINAVWFIVALILFIAGLGPVALIALIPLVVTMPLSMVSYLVAYRKFATYPAQNVQEKNGMMIMIIIGLFLITMIGVIAVASAGFMAALSKYPELQYSLQGDNQSQSPYMNPASEDEMQLDMDSEEKMDSSYLSDTFKTAFVDSCSQSGGDSKTCTCMADYLLANYSDEELLEISQKTLETGEIPQELTKAATACVNQ